MINCYSLKYRFQSILFLSFVFLFISIPPLYSQETKCVVIENFQVSEAGPFSYLGPAIKKMLETRLAAEEIQVIDTDSPDMKSDSCFSLSGHIKSPEKGKIVIDILMTDMAKKRHLNRWEISSKDLNTVLSDISRRSVEIADSIEEYEDASIITSQGSEKKAVESESVIQDESLAIAKMHPDRMLYEKNIAVTPASEAIGSEGVSPSDNGTLETPKSSPVLTDIENEDAPSKKKILYLTSREKLPFSPPTPLEPGSQDGNITDNSEKINMETVHEKASQDGAKGVTPTTQNQVQPDPQGVSKRLQKQDNKTARNKDDSGWFSWLWPWGGEDESSQDTVFSKQENSSVNQQKIPESKDNEFGPVDSDSLDKDSEESFETDGEQEASPKDHKPLWKWN